MEFKHISVLLNETVDCMMVREGGVYLDGTLGGAGHSSLIASKLETGHLYGVDQDSDAIEAASKRLQPYEKNVTVIRDNYRNAVRILKEMGVGGADGILLDLGVSSWQFDQGDRGFSYNYDAPLDMRMDTRKDLSAAVIVNEYPEEEIRRIVPVIKELAPMIDVPISVDTMDADVARAALDAGASIINDVNGLRSEGMMELASSAGVPVIIMHMNGEPKTMQIHPMEGSVVGEIASFLKERCDIAREYGIRDITLDPGIGFGKTVVQNMEIIENASSFSFGHPVLIGASRKRFLSEIYPGTDRDEATVKASLRAFDSGADILRVHNVKMRVDALSDHLHQDAD